MEQRSDEWFAARLGKVTASRVADVIAQTKTGYSSSRKNYLTELLCERLTGTKAEGYSNAAMQRGTELEPVARSIYEMESGLTVIETGFVDHPEIAMTGASPDGLVGDEGLIEIKCPNPATHLETLLIKEAPKKYIPQIQWQLACTGREWCDFVSYAPEFPDDMKLFICRVFRDEGYIRNLELEIQAFLRELDLTLTEIRG